MQKEVTYQTVNTYDTLNELTKDTKNVWLVLHGIGYLSRFFIQLFKELNPTENYIIAPQAPSKYYKGENYRKVGASWLTKENTTIDTQNILRYIDTIIEEENISDGKKLIVLGYSQGVSIASRWVSSRKILASHLIFVSGGFPKELHHEDFDFLTPQTKVSHILGESDPYFEKEKVEAEKIRVKQIIPQIIFKTHPGGHELNIQSILDLI